MDVMADRDVMADHNRVQAANDRGLREGEGEGERELVHGIRERECVSVVQVMNSFRL